jgi:hypothetical protein
MDPLTTLLVNYELFEEKRIKDRFFKHTDLLKILNGIKKNSDFNIKEAGFSTNGRSINLITWGKGPKRVFLWSQMHGDEATATMSIADLLNFLSKPDQYKHIDDLDQYKHIHDLHILLYGMLYPLKFKELYPMVNLLVYLPIKTMLYILKHMNNPKKSLDYLINHRKNSSM